MGLIWSGMVVVMAAGASPVSPPAEPVCHALPEGFVRLSEALPGVRLDVRYATAHNFTGAPLPGYGRPTLWALQSVATALAEVRRGLAEDGLDIIIYDAYRPERASAAMVAWTHRTDQTELLSAGYIAPRSGHNHGHTVDLSLISRDTGQLLDMGGAWDAFSPISHAGAVSGDAGVARARLRQAMEAAGFRPYTKEWWHFRLPVEGTRPWDVPYGCDEPGAFTAPAGWREPGWAPRP